MARHGVFRASFTTSSAVATRFFVVLLFMCARYAAPFRKSNTPSTNEIKGLMTC